MLHRPNAPSLARDTTKLDCEAWVPGTRILVTGHTGFTGGWLTLWLQRLGAHVSGLALPPTGERNLFTSAGLEHGMLSMIGDMRDVGRVNDAFARAEPQVVIHLAAQPLVSRSYEDPLETLSTNVMGTANVLEAARSHPSVKAVVCITTDKVYEDQQWSWGYRENDPLGGKDCYSASKACAELVAGCYRATLAGHGHGNGVRIATARGGNIIGGGDWSDNRIVPDFVRAVERGHSLSLRNPEAVRPWQHVLCLVHGYIALAGYLLEQGEDYDPAWNLGPIGIDARPVRDLVETLLENWPESGIGLDYAAGAFHETSFLHLDSTKAFRDLVWRPALDFQQTVAYTADWYRRFLENGACARELTLDQINRYRRSVPDATSRPVSSPPATAAPSS